MKRLKQGIDPRQDDSVKKPVREVNKQSIHPSKKKTRVLGRQTLGELWRDMERTLLPSNVTPVPKTVGTTRHGKLSADQWRTTCTIHLVYTLIRLWGEETENWRHRAMLENFIDLVTATKLAAMRTMSEERILLFQSHMLRYLRGLLDLYPGTTLSPNQHLSVHLTQLFRRWGPTHAWRCFAFERYNFKLQRIPTNMRLGTSTILACN